MTFSFRTDRFGKTAIPTEQLCVALIVLILKIRS